MSIYHAAEILAGVSLKRLLGRISKLLLATFISAGFLSSHAWAQLPPPPTSPKVDANGVDIITGNISYSRPELDIGPPGENGLHFVRYLSAGVYRDSFDSTFHSIDTIDIPYQAINASFGAAGDSFGMFGVGPGAFITYGINSVPTYKQKNGTKVVFGLNMWDQYGAYGDGSEDKYRLADSVIYGSGVTWIVHYKVISQPYFPAVRIQSVTTNTGYQIKFTYQSNVFGTAGWSTRSSAKAINNSIEYCDPDADTCTLSHSWPTVLYSYSSSPNVMSVTDAIGGVTLYSNGGSYSAPGGSTAYISITNPGSPVASIKYNMGFVSGCPATVDVTNPCSLGSDFRVTSVVLPYKTVSYTYNAGADQITVTDPGGIQTKYHSVRALNDGEFALAQSVDPLNRVYNFQADSNGLATRAQWPESNYVTWNRDSAGNVVDEIAYAKPSSGSSLVRHQTFDPCTETSMTCDKPRTVSDPQGNTTAFQYNMRGQEVSEVGPPDSHNVRKVTLLSYTDLYAYVKNSAGSMVPAASPVSTLTSETVCEGVPGSSAAVCSTATGAVNVVTTYEYGAAGAPNTLLRRAKVVDQGAGKLNLRTCYGYDDYGNNVFETTPRAGLTTCS